MNPLTFSPMERRLALLAGLFNLIVGLAFFFLPELRWPLWPVSISPVLDRFIGAIVLGNAAGASGSHVNANGQAFVPWQLSPSSMALWLRSRCSITCCSYMPKPFSGSTFYSMSRSSLSTMCYSTITILPRTWQSEPRTGAKRERSYYAGPLR